MAVCTRCGAEIPDDAHFYPSCGAPVAAERPTEERKGWTAAYRLDHLLDKMRP